MKFLREVDGRCAYFDIFFDLYSTHFEGQIEVRVGEDRDMNGEIVKSELGRSDVQEVKSMNGDCC